MGRTAYRWLIQPACDFEGGDREMLDFFRRRVVRALLVAPSALLLSFSPAFAQNALPDGGSVAAGSVQIGESQDGALQIDQSSTHGIINWNGFSIGADNSVQIDNGSGATLNRVTGAATSQIDGSLNSTGSVYLINPNGVVVGSSGVITAGGSAIVSTRDVTNEDFLAGEDRFKGDSAGGVVNMGRVEGGGDVALIGASVSNSGVVSAPNGLAALAAGEEIYIADTDVGEGRVMISLGAPDAAVTQSGLVEGAAAELRVNAGNVFALAGNTSHITHAATAVTRGDRIYLVADGGEALIQGEIDASSDSGPGGSINIEGRFVSLGGDISADGATGGSVSVRSTGTLSIAETITARGFAGAGGAIDLEADGDILAPSSALIDASGATDGGSIRQIGRRDQILSATYRAVGQSGVGGQIDFGGGAIRLLGATVSVDGATGGGRIRVGGERGGGFGSADDELENSLRVSTSDSSRFSADATGDFGDGGEIIFWADENAYLFGSATARGGLLGGQGGFIETSAGGTPQVRLAGLETARDGERGGEILIDPKNIIVDYVDPTFLYLGGGAAFPSLYNTYNERHGDAVSLDGVNLAVGATGDDGASDDSSGFGAIRLFTFDDRDFSGGRLIGTIGRGYVGPDDVDVSGLIGPDDYLGGAVSLDGTRIAVGVRRDDGADDDLQDAGAVHLFTFTDAQMGGGAYAGSIGAGYSDGASLDISGLLDAYDEFGTSVSLDGARLAVGAPRDDGVGGYENDEGAVYLFTFDDLAFAEGELAATIRDGDSGGANDVDVGGVLEGYDSFGASVSLDADRLAVGAHNDRGAANTASGAGAVHLFTFADSDFSGGALEATLGVGYEGAKDVDLAALLSTYDNFGASVSLDGDRLAVGAPFDDGGPSVVNYSSYGATHLFSFGDSSFSGGALVASIGAGYAGPLSQKLPDRSGSYYFGSSVSLDGDRLAVGAPLDDGVTNNAYDVGAVHIFGFDDSSFGGGEYVAIVGEGYQPDDGAYVDLAGLIGSRGDSFGSAVSLDGRRLVVGARYDDGGSNSGNTGSVALFTFSDDAFGGGEFVGAIGDGYRGGLNVDVATQVDGNDYFGSSVSLDGLRLAVGAPYADGRNNSVRYSGEVHLFTFDDLAFSGGAHAGVIGSGHDSDGDVAVTALEQYDHFGSSVSLDGDRLAVGAPADWGAGNATNHSGAAYLFKFSDMAFGEGELVGRIGAGYDGPSDIDISANLDTSDSFGVSLSLDGRQLAVGARYDDGAGNSSSLSGAVHLFTFSDDSLGGGAHAGSIGYRYTGDASLDLSTLPGSLNGGYRDEFGISVSLDQNRLAVGAPRDDGATDQAFDVGAVYLFSFADAAFASPTLQGVIGSGYDGDADIDLPQNVERYDDFGWAVSLDGTRLVVGAPSDDGSANEFSAAGAVYLYTFSDQSFSDGELVGGWGAGSAGNVVDLPTGPLGRYDYFGASVALDGTRVAVGATGDDGADDSVGDAGAVYLFKFADEAFTSGEFVGIIGHGYGGGSNVDLTDVIENGDAFGASVSLDGRRLAVGARDDDGYENRQGRTGAVHLFTFADDAFGGGAHVGSIGNGYSGDSSLDLTGRVSSTDYFAWSLSLNGDRLAVGAWLDDGATNQTNNAGAVYLFEFADAAFGSPSLTATIGAGYGSGKDIDLTGVVDRDDYFGRSVALDGTRLVVGATGDDGEADGFGSAGAAYLFTFADEDFTAGALAGRIGAGYSGDGDLPLGDLYNVGAGFGESVALDGTTLLVGAPSDDGLNGTYRDFGAVHIFDFVGAEFDGLMRVATIGARYDGPLDLDFSRASGVSSRERFGAAIALDEDRIAIGAWEDYGPFNRTSSVGGVFILDRPGARPSPNSDFDDAAGETVTISPSDILALLNGGNDVTLRASNDVMIEQALFANSAADVGDFSVIAGRSIDVNNNIYTYGGDITFLANAPASYGVVDTHRDEGEASIRLAYGVVVDAGDGDIIAEIGSGEGNTENAVGEIAMDLYSYFRGYNVRLSNMYSDDAQGIEFGRIYAQSDVVAETTGELDFLYRTSIHGGNDVTLAGSKLNFYQSYPVYAGGRYLVFSTRPDHDYRPHYLYRTNYYHYNVSYESGADYSHLPAGNGQIYSVAPVMTVTAYDGSYTYGSPQTYFSASRSLQVDGENVNTGVYRLTGNYNVSVTPLPTSSSGYVVAGLHEEALVPTVVEGSVNGGIAVQTVAGDLRVNKRYVGAYGVTADKVYDGTTDATMTIRPYSWYVQSGDDVELVAGDAYFYNDTVGYQYSIGRDITFIGADGGNYYTSSNFSDYAYINPRLLAVSAVASDKIYDGGVDAEIQLFDDRVAGDIFEVLYGSAEFDSAEVGADRTVSVGPLGLQGSDARNYRLATTQIFDTADIVASEPATFEPLSTSLENYPPNQTLDARPNPIDGVRSPGPFGLEGGWETFDACIGLGDSCAVGPLTLSNNGESLAQ